MAAPKDLHRGRKRIKRVNQHLPARVPKFISGSMTLANVRPALKHIFLRDS